MAMSAGIISRAGAADVKSGQKIGGIHADTDLQYDLTHDGFRWKYP
jgi:hypothetical protein